MVMRQRLLNICNVLSVWQVQKLQLGTNFPLVLHYHCLVTSADPVLAPLPEYFLPTPPAVLLLSPMGSAPVRAAVTDPWAGSSW